MRSLLEQHGTLYNAARTNGAIAGAGGRLPAYVMPVDNDRWVVRHYHRGGGVRWLHDRYLRLGHARALHELRVSAIARGRLIATPVVIAAAAYPSGPFVRYDIVTKFVPNARDLADILFYRPVTEGLLDRVVDLIQQIVQHGMLHRDLNLKNVLVAETRAWVIDLDRCKMRENRRTADALAMQRRFIRSLDKWEHKLGRKVPHAHRVRLEQAFHA